MLTLLFFLIDLVVDVVDFDVDGVFDIGVDVVDGVVGCCRW